MLAACGTTSNEPARPDDRGALDASAKDAGETVARSGCPAPVPVSATDLVGFRATERVTLVRATDGDTATFRRPGGAEVTVRFLFVNTEEAFGDEMTEYGKAVAEVVGGYLRSARQLEIAIREGDGADELDTFGRSLGLVFLDAELLQSRIVREGLSPYYTAFGCASGPVHVNLLHSEAEARGNERGLWKPGHPTDYRPILEDWIGSSTCRNNPYERAYCSR